MSISIEDLGFRHIGRTKIPNNWRGIYRSAGYDFRPKDLLRHSLRTGEGSCFPTIALIRKDETAKGVAAVSRSLVENRIRADALGVKNVFSSTSVLEDLIRETAKSNTSDPRFLHMCNNALALAARPDDLTYLMNQVILPAFFSRFPLGQMQCLSSSNVIEEIRTIMTLQYSAEHHNICQADDIAGSMRKWHSADSEQLLRGILGMAGFLWPPYVTSYVTGTYQSPILVQLDPPSKEKIAPFGHVWSDYLRHGSEFAAEDLPLSDAFTSLEAAAHQKLSHRKRLTATPPSLDARLAFQDWLLKAVQRFLINLCDICNFTKAHDPYERIDAVFAMEHLWTIERIIKLTLQVSGTRDPSMARSLTFQIADLYETLALRFGRIKNETDFFKDLFNPSTGCGMISSRLQRIEGVGADLAKTCDAVYADIRDVAINSIWKKSKVDPSRTFVRVKDKSLRHEVNEPIDEFVGNLMRALRNGHHGYFTDGDKKSKRPSRYLWLVDGNTPDSIANLPILWFFAYLSDQSFVGWNPLGFGLRPI